MNALPNSPRVLLIAPRFFGYDQEIAAELIRSGRQVDILPDRPFSSPLMKAIMRFRPGLGGLYACDRFFAQRLEELGRNDYEKILVIQGEGVTARTLKRLRGAFPRSKIVYYTWDSIENKPLSKRKLILYDRCSTFDPVDAKKYGMRFRPLFYTDGFNRAIESTEWEYDLSFIGTVHSDRYSIVNAVTRQLLPDAKAFIYMYLQATWMYDYRRIFTNTLDGARREEFRFAPLNKEVVQSVFFSSRAVLDIEHNLQRGATMRTLEALGSRRKMITTNNTLSDYDFYDQRNIQIISRKAPRLNPEFLCTPYVPVGEKIRTKYSLRYWVDDVCGFGD